MLILDTLHYCMRVNTQQALAAGAMETFTKLLDHASDVIRAKAARDIMDLRYPVDIYNQHRLILLMTNNYKQILICCLW